MNHADNHLIPAAARPDFRFAQLALPQDMRQVEEKVGDPVRTAYKHPHEAAKILAKSFFKEMTKAGFGASQIVCAASELIGQLHQHLPRRLQGAAGDEPDI
ncbi:hypothetical protein [Collimonas fungivorans]|uniref:hypothetical protein n=1 Tax=Collimonas fungivorans TaxID=158899 RepID=UPI0026EF4498|nr:hypothetical protein [Collimonas fungivorans]